jgi:hypothetical protein
MLNEWHDLFVVTGGAAAALTGLIFVGVSLNLTKILAYASLPNRALLSLLMLLNILIVSILFLIPGQGVIAVGAEILIVEIIFYIMTLRLDIINYKSTAAQYKKQYVVHITIDQLAAIPYLIAAVAILCWSEKGVYIIIPGIIFSFCKAIFDSWVLLVEINR